MRPEPGTDGDGALLKVALRTFGLRCVAVGERQTLNRRAMTPANAAARERKKARITPPLDNSDAAINAP